MKSKEEIFIKEIPEGPTFRPTLEEFTYPEEYISKIRPHFEKYGICKIVSPIKSTSTLSKTEFKFITKIQPIHQLQKRIVPESLEKKEKKKKLNEPKEKKINEKKPEIEITKTEEKNIEIKTKVKEKEIIIIDENKKEKEKNTYNLRTKNLNENNIKETELKTEIPKEKTIKIKIKNLINHENKIEEKSELINNFIMNLNSNKIAQKKRKLEEDDDEEKSFGYTISEEEITLNKFRKDANEFKKKYIDKMKVKRDSTKKIQKPYLKKLARRGGILKIHNVNYFNEHSEDECKKLDISLRDLEDEYWGIVEKQSDFVEVQYGSDLDVQVHGTGFSNSF
jgi:hypothetical protein